MLHHEVVNQILSGRGLIKHKPLVQFHGGGIFDFGKRLWSGVKSIFQPTKLLTSLKDAATDTLKSAGTAFVNSDGGIKDRFMAGLKAGANSAKNYGKIIGQDIMQGVIPSPKDTEPQVLVPEGVKETVV